MQFLLSGERSLSLNSKELLKRFFLFFNPIKTNYTRNRFLENHNSALRAKKNYKIPKKGYIFCEHLLKCILMKPKIETRLTTGLRKHFVLLSFKLLHFTDNHVFYKLKICSNPFLNKSIGAIFLTLFAQFVSLYQVLIILTRFQFVYYYDDYIFFMVNCDQRSSMLPLKLFQNDINHGHVGLQT